MLQKRVCRTVTTGLWQKSGGYNGGEERVLGFRDHPDPMSGPHRVCYRFELSRCLFGQDLRSHQWVLGVGW